MIDELVNRVRQILVDASMLAEGKSTNLDPKIHASKADGGAPTTGGDEALESVASSLEEWCRARERWVKDQRRRVAPALEGDSIAFWILRAEGRDYRDVAVEFGVSQQRVCQIRRDGEQRVEDGRPLKIAPRKDRAA